MPTPPPEAEDDVDEDDEDMLLLSEDEAEPAGVSMFCTSLEICKYMLQCYQMY